MKIKISIFTGLFLLLAFLTAFATWDKKPEFRWEQLYRYDLRQDKHQLYTNRISSTFNYLDNNKNSLFKLTPFFEIRRNIDKDLCERKELGVEIGKDIFPWIYFAESIQKVWMKEDYRYYANFEERDYMGSYTRLKFSHDLLPKTWMKLKGFVLDEYTFDFNRMSGTRNDVVLGLVLPLSKYVEAGINWRHIDRIHYYDSDTCEASLTMVF